jgi:peptide-methionine (S)-S-oxide reductase
MKTFVLGGGCFWCLDAVYQKTRGVTSVVSGYTGGHDPNPDYYSVCNGTTGHAEVVAVTFDEDIVPADVILDMFFALPSSRRQGNITLHGLTLSHGYAASLG